MKIYYGYDDAHYVDITDIIIEKCLQNNNIHIPAGDIERSKLIEFDPYPGIVKHIMIMDNNKQRKFNQTENINMTVSSGGLKIKNIKEWWNETGRHMTDIRDKLNKLHNYINLLHGNMNEELVEQTMAISYIKPDAKVLELGGNIGRNTIVITTILDDSSNLVCLESDPAIANLLSQNIAHNNINCHIVAAALSKRRLVQRGWDTIPIGGADNIPFGWKEIPTITYDDLIAKYQVEFDTLVADCEGALYYILMDEPTILNGINLVVMENDYRVLEHKQFINHLLEVQGFKRVFYQAGGWGPCQECFWEVWQRAEAEGGGV
jgi:FkbM family methyltransferase